MIATLRLPLHNVFGPTLHVSKIGTLNRLCFLSAAFYSNPIRNPNLAVTLRVSEWRPDSILVLTRNRKLLLPADILERRRDAHR